MDGVLPSLVTDLLKQLGSFAAQQALQELQLLVGVDDELQNLQYNFKMVQAMLNKFEERRLKDEAVKLWYDKLEDAYYMMDDVLDTWKTAEIKLQIQKEEEGEKAAYSNAPAPLEKKMKKVWSFFPSPSCCFRQVDNVSVRHEVGHKIKRLNETLANILKGKQEFGIDLNSQPERVERLEITSIVDVSKIVGRNEYKDDPLNNLLGVGSQQESNPLVISLVGIGGIGKSTLAKLAYNHLKVKDHFQKIMWVCVSDPFNECKVAKAIIQELDPKHESLNNTTTTLQALLRIVCDLIKDKKFFLVLDDVWAKDPQKESEKWEPFKAALTHGGQGSRILVTTRNEEVAHMMGSKAHIINLGNLSVDDCWLIIRKIAFIDENIDQHKDLEPLGRQLADKCHGLPLAAKLIGSYMYKKRSEEEWVEVLESSLWDLEDVEKGPLGPLLLSYYELSPAEKQCFLYCAIFPKDHVINRFELIIHWMAQGYIDSKGNRAMEYIAEEYFKKLAMRSFFQDFEKDKDDGRIKSCKMHDIVHDFAQSLTKDVCFTIECEEEVKIDFKRARSLSLIVKETFPESVYEAKNLRTLFLLSHERGYEFNMHLSNSCHHFRCLRTLILDCPIMKLPDVVENLIHLRCLHMCSNVRIKELPESLCNLCNLQTLNIDNTHYLKKLPLGIGKLTNLRQLRLYGPVNEVKFPNGIEKLTCLRTLSDFNISGKDDKKGCKLGELKNLNQLRGSFKMHGLGNVVDVGEAKNAQLKEKIDLHFLELDFYGESQLDEEESRRRMESDIAVLNALELPPRLEKLSIKGVMGTTVYTNWMMSLTNLKSLYILRCSQLECLPPLGKLPLLKELCIWSAIKVKKLGDEFLGIESENKSKKDDCHIINIFPNLRVLDIGFLYSCEEWIGMGGKGLEVEEEKDRGLVSDPIIKIMPRLERLQIQCCDKLKCLPDYLRTTPLQKLFIYDCPILKQRCEREIGDYWPIVSHVPTIEIDHDYVQINSK